MIETVKGDLRPGTSAVVLLSSDRLRQAVDDAIARNQGQPPP